MLKDKVALITGGSRGIGAAVAAEFAARGVHVAILYATDEAAADAVTARCQTQGVRALSLRCNVAEGEAVKAAVAAVKGELGGVDILVNNAGITRDGLVAAMKREAFDEVLAVNLGGAFNLIRHVAPLMLRNRWGRIVNISSVAGLMGNSGQANYAAAKAGLIGLTKSVARELASRQITCNAVAPGLIRTDMTKQLTAENELAASIPLQRLGEPEEVARAVVFLAGAGYITGEVLRIDGGLAM